jgi:sugar/nucleoside kinase (ribokinase family)
MKIGVLGDFCVDFYWEINPNISEKSLNTSMMASKAENPRYFLGGAGNVVKNITSLSGNKINPICFGAISNDPFGLWMKNNLPNSDNVVVCDKYHTAVYCKPIIQEIEQPRIDFGNIELPDEYTDILLERIRVGIKKIDVLIINQQLKNGIHTPYFRKGLFDIIQKNKQNKIFISDVRSNFESYVGSIFKINSHAASLFAFKEEGKCPMESGMVILKKYNVPLVITDGINGSYIFENENYKHIPSIPQVGKIDTIGAGDAFTSGFAYAISCGANMETAAEFATCCSSVVVKKIHQAGFPTKQELKSLLKEINE